MRNHRCQWYAYPVIFNKKFKFRNWEILMFRSSWNIFRFIQYFIIIAATTNKHSQIYSGWKICKLFLPTIKESTCQCGRDRRHRFNLCVRKIPWRSKWQPIPIFLPGKSHGQRSLGATVHRVAKSWTWLKWLTTHACRRIELKLSHTPADR